MENGFARPVRRKGSRRSYLAEKLSVSRQAVSKWEKDLSCPDTQNLIALAELLGITVEYLASGNTAEAGELSPEQPENNGALAHGFRIAGLICMAVMFLCWLIGLCSGEYTDMVTIPLEKDGSLRLGIPFLMYGESPAAILLLVISIVSLILMVLCLILGNAAEKNGK